MTKAQFLQEHLRPGEDYAGLLLGENGEPDRHIFLLSSSDNKKFTWDQAVKAAIKAGGTLPTRREQSLLIANLKSQFQPDWYWSCERHAINPSYAWYQSFTCGHQSLIHKSYEAGARFVRHVPVVE